MHQALGDHETDKGHYYDILTNRLSYDAEDHAVHYRTRQSDRTTHMKLVLHGAVSLKAKRTVYLGDGSGQDEPDAFFQTIQNQIEAFDRDDVDATVREFVTDAIAYQ